MVEEGIDGFIDNGGWDVGRCGWVDECVDLDRVAVWMRDLGVAYLTIYEFYLIINHVDIVVRRAQSVR